MSGECDLTEKGLLEIDHYFVRKCTIYSVRFVFLKAIQSRGSSCYRTSVRGVIQLLKLVQIGGPCAGGVDERRGNVDDVDSDHADLTRPQTPAEDENI